MSEFPLRSWEEARAERASEKRSLWSRIKAAWPTGAGGGVKALEFIPADAAYDIATLPRTNFLYGRDVRSGLDSNVVMAPVNWIIRNFTEAEPVVERRRDDRWEEAADHKLKVLLDEPNDFYDGDLLWKATLTSYLLDGNAYWQKVRNVFGEVIELWYLPHFLVDPKWPNDGSEFISHYEFRPNLPGMEPDDIPVRDIVHLRWGLDPRNPRKGMSSLKPLLREVFTDEEASNFSASILRNMGVPGGVIGPKDASALPKPDDVEQMKEHMRTGFTGDKRGEWLVLGVPTDVKQFGFDPSQLLLTNLRDISEERVCAQLGIPAAVVGFGAGLQQTKVGATLRELRRLAWVACIIPHQTSLGRQASRQLIADFQSQIRRFRLRFDASQVSAFLEEETERAKRFGLLVEKGILRVDRAQQALGLEVDPTQDVYLRPTGSVAVPADGEEAVPTSSENGGPPVDDDAVEETINRARRLLEASERKE